MKKIAIFLIFILILGFFVNQKIIAQNEVLEPLPPKPLTPIESTQAGQTGSTDLSGGKGPLAGLILYKKALKIQSLEAAGYICPVLGETIEIKKQKETHKYPTSYFIPSFVKAKYQTTPGKAILGYYSGKTTITCTHPLGATETVTLSNIVKYGVSKNVISVSLF